MRLRVRYHRLEDLVRDHDEQLARGGLLVRVEPPEGLQQFAELDLEIFAPRGSVVLRSQVVQLFPGVGVAVTFEPSAVLLAAVNNARHASPSEGPPPEHEVVDAEPAARAQSPSRVVATPDKSAKDHPEPEADKPAADKPSTDKMKLAIHGNRDERAAILRDTNPSFHVYVLRNPGIQVDEVLSIAKLRTVGPELLKAIADRREWSQRADIALALVRNPKTPVPVAVRMLEHVSATDLRALAKDNNTRPPVQQAARKKVLG